jgi:hypothetical protein
MNAPNLVALAASVLLAGTSIAALGSFDGRAAQMAAAPRYVNGVRVVDLPGIVVRPTDAQVREADASVAVVLDAAASALKASAEDRAAALLSSQITMPYYSFGTAIRPTAKD